MDDMRSRFKPEIDRTPALGRKHLQVALEHLELPDLLPPLSGGGGTSEDGTRWIAREALPGVTAARYLLTDESLRPLATIELPENALRIAGPVDRDHLWVVEKDDFDVPYLVRYRIRRN